MENPSITPLLEVLRTCTANEQLELATLAGTTRNYLYQLATCREQLWSDYLEQLARAGKSRDPDESVVRLML